ncbi:myelin and lymphocyte protein-like isoform X2 [Petromyzon marinus]|uniref:MARVEL domain-containing protein 1-like isoform X2 n=1 Tax=Petromyzon marinus TaxID=7757 RepID=A0AAJ7WYY0_PETMA|nr:MARVEL domain-containing protein 1-like isoform X2 [Petromyzon marinus]
MDHETSPKRQPPGYVPWLPLGQKVFTSKTGLLILLEILCCAVVWALLAASRLPRAFHAYQGFCMFVPVFLFVASLVQLLLYATRVPERAQLPWSFLANLMVFNDVESYSAIVYNLNIAASVISFYTTLLYFISAVVSVKRRTFY